MKKKIQKEDEQKQCSCEWMTYISFKEKSELIRFTKETNTGLSLLNLDILSHNARLGFTG
jgi:hypothetical protein